MQISSWTQLLEIHNITLDQVNRHTDQALAQVIEHQPANSFCLLSDLQVLSVTGSDRHRFLQGQLTCDVNDVANGKLVIGAQCNLKGRIDASGFLLDHDDATLVILPAGQATHFRDLLSKFAVFSQVELQLRDDLLVFGLLGERDNWNDVSLPIASLAHQAAHADGVSLASLDADASVWLGVALPDSLSTLLTKLAEHPERRVTSAEPWHLARMYLGMPLVWPEAREQWLPQELRYDQIGAVSFRKGCYKGQEVIARIHYRGQVKQQLACFRTDQQAHIAINDYVIAGSTQKHAGQVLEKRHFPGGQAFLAVVHRDLLESTTVFLEQNDSESGPALHPAYAITNEYFS